MSACDSLLGVLPYYSSLCFFRSFLTASSEGDFDFDLIEYQNFFGCLFKAYIIPFLYNSVLACFSHILCDL